MFNTIIGAGAASRYGSGSAQKMRLLAAPAPQHWNQGYLNCLEVYLQHSLLKIQNDQKKVSFFMC
jgi:hypothetical protein